MSIGSRIFEFNTSSPDVLGRELNGEIKAEKYDSIEALLLIGEHFSFMHKQ